MLRRPWVHDPDHGVWLARLLPGHPVLDYTGRPPHTIDQWAVTTTDLLRAARDLESKGYPAEADRLRWLAASRAVTGSVASKEPAPSGDACAGSASSCLLEAAIRDAEAVGDLATVGALLSALASSQCPSRRAA